MYLNKNFDYNYLFEIDWIEKMLLFNKSYRYDLHHKLQEYQLAMSGISGKDAASTKKIHTKFMDNIVKAERNITQGDKTLSIDEKQKHKQEAKELTDKFKGSFIRKKED